MKKIYFLFLMALLPLLANAVVKRTINVATAGTLPDLISDADKHRIQKLTLTGELNGTDIKFIREMAGDSVYIWGDYYATHSETKGRLTSLDISKVDIVKGGAPYYYHNYDFERDLYVYYTKQNSISYYMFCGLRLKEIVLPNSVTSIGNSAFNGCNDLTSITIPSGVTSIGVCAFMDCSNLTSINILKGVTSIAYGTFKNCSGLTSVSIPSSVTSIGGSAFEGCTGLTSLTIPSSVTSIGEKAFSGTAWYDKKTDGVVYAGKVFYTYKGTMPEGTKISIKKGTIGIADRAFDGCKSLTSITIPSSMTCIGQNAFLGCGELTTVYISDLAAWCGISFGDGYSYSNPLYYANHLFLNGTEIKDLVIPDGVTNIGSSAFENCTSLTSVTIPSSVTSIGYSVFRGCSSLTSIKVASGNTVYDSRDKCNAIIETETNKLIVGCKNTVIPTSVTSIGFNAFNGCSGLTSVTIPSSVTSIDDCAFYHCSGLTSVTIGNGIQYIGNYAFQSCSGLTSVTIPNSVTSIGYYAFCQCSGMTSITIGNGIQHIDNYAFAVCPKLTNVYCYAENVPSTDYSLFSSSNIENATLHVPVGSLEAYKAEKPWNEFKSIVKITAKVCLSKSEAIIEKGKTVTLKATVTPSTLLDKSVTWKSSNTKIATVTNSGKVKGIKAGTATITCTSNVSGKKVSCKVTVINGTVTLNKTEAIIEKGKTTTLKATLTPTTLEDMSVTWTSSDKSIATVTSKGKVKGVGYGTATITCTSNATGVSATCQVTVGKVVMNSPEFTLRKSRTMTLIATVYPTTLTDKSVTWTSSDKSVATVTSSGKVKGIKAGTATITCTSVATGLKGTCTVTVLATSESRSTDGNDDNVTGIKELKENSVATEPYDVYDLSGRKVLNQTTTLDGLPAGVYIVNGHKVLRK